jgi:hypothetical protein
MNGPNLESLNDGPPTERRRKVRLKRSLTGIGIFVAVGFILGAVSARADVYMKQKTHTGSFTVMGKTQPEKDETTVIWIADNKVRSDQGTEKSILFFADKGILYIIDHAKKTYAEMPLDFGKAMNDALAGRGEEAQKMAGMMKGMMGSMSAKVTETGETKKIGNWDCRKYLIDMKIPMGEMNSETWATEDIKIDPKLYFSAINAMMASMPGFQEMIKEMQKIKGVVAYQMSTTKVMGADVTSTMELLECADKGAPAGTYDLPASYTKVKGMKGMS